MKIRVICLLASFCLFNQQVLAEQSGGEIVPRYEGSVLQSQKVEEFADYKLVTAVSAKGEIAGENIQGKLIRLVYGNPKDRSTLEIFTNYANSLKSAGLTPLFSCALKECGPSYALSSWNRYNGLFSAADGDPRYLGGKIVDGATEKYVSLMVGRNRTQLDIVEVKAMQENMATAEVLGQGIDRDGKVSVYGIYFDTDKATIKGESKPAIEEMAKLLKSRPDLKVFIVGHTDMVGNVEHNQKLSEARARAVVKQLVEVFGIHSERLDGQGVGPLAPVAPNTTEAGRAKNRRVEIVVRATKS